MAPTKQEVTDKHGRDPRKYGAKCTECPYAVGQAPNKPVFGEGPPSPIGILVGEAPGRDDADCGRPFTGMSGRQLDEELLLVGLLREKLFAVLACACQPPFKKSPSDQRKAALACRPRLLKELEPFAKETPTFVMGKYALIGLNGVDMPGGIKNARGFVRPSWSIPGDIGEKVTIRVAEDEDSEDFDEDV